MFVAKAESKVFLLNEISANIYTLLFSVLGYKFWGLQGIGVAFALNYLLYFIQVYLIAHHRYQFSFSANFIRCYVMQFIFVVTSLSVVLVFDGFTKYVIGVFLILLSSSYGFRGINQRLDLVTVLKNKLNK